MPTIIFRQAGKPDRAVTVPQGLSLMLAAKGAGLPIAGTCGGQLACATCHVIVAEDWADRLEPASEDETAMLDLVFDLQATSRLCCQIKADPALDGLTVTIP